MKKTACIILLNFFFLCFVNSQNSFTRLKEDFLAAESYMLFEEYNEALPLYLRLIRAYPENDNYNFKIGICYLNNPFEKNKSIYYLEKAIKNINPRYKEGTFREDTAPLEALYYLGNAYRINNQLDKAREFYKKFINQLDPAKYKIELVKDQIAACDAAEKLMMNPVDIDSINLGEPVNTRFAEMNPVISGDGTKMAYVSKLQFYDAVLYIEQVNGKWSYPRNILPELREDNDVYPTCLSYDGKTMFVYRNDDFLGNIYTTKLVDGKWTPLVKLNENINTKYWESHASISKDGNTLYFTSNRKDNYGGLDIYYSKKLAGGDWGPAKNLGPVINTRYNEDTPFITEDGSRIFFSSYGHYNMGGYDIFMSLRINDTLWTEPVNLGYPINTTDDDLFFNPVANGRFAYYSMFDESGFGRNDIYRYVVYSKDHPRKFAITGQLDYSGVIVDSFELNISVVDSQKNDTLDHVRPDSSGKFIVTVPAGQYDLIFESKSFEKIIQSIMVGRDIPHTGMALTKPIELIPLSPTLNPEEPDQLLEIEDSVINVRDGLPVEIRYNAETGSRVIIILYHNSEQVSSDTIEIEMRRQTYTFKPMPGTNIVVITLKDNAGKSITKSVTVINKNVDISGIAGSGIPGTRTTAETQNNKSPKFNFSFVSDRQQFAKLANNVLKGVSRNLKREKERHKIPIDFHGHMKKNAGKYEFTNSDNDALVLASYNIKIAEDIKSLDPLMPRKASPSSIRKGIFYSILVMAILTFIILFLIWFEHKKRKKVKGF